MNDIASTTDLENRLGITFDVSYETPRAQALLDMAVSQIRAHCKQHITLVTDDSLTVPGRWGDRILLPERPVVDVSYVSATFYDGTPYTFPEPTYYIDRDELVRYPFPIGLVRHFFTTGNGWLGPGYKITIVYSHGYNPDASPLPYQLALAQGIACEMVARVWINPESAQQSMIGGVQSMFPAVGLKLTADEMALLDDTFRRHTQSVSLR